MKAKTEARAVRLAAKREAMTQDAAAEPAPVEGPADEKPEQPADKEQK